MDSSDFTHEFGVASCHPVIAPRTADHTVPQLSSWTGVLRVHPLLPAFSEGGNELELTIGFRYANVSR